MGHSRAGCIWVGGAERPSGVDPLVKALKDKDGAVRTAAVWALERVGDARAVPGLGRGADRSHGRGMRRVCCKKFGDVRAVDALIDGLMGTNWMVRRHAAQALGKIGDARGVDPLIESLKTEDWLVRRNAAESLYAGLGAKAGDRPPASAARR